MNSVPMKHAGRGRQAEGFPCQRAKLSRIFYSETCGYFARSLESADAERILLSTNLAYSCRCGRVWNSRSQCISKGSKDCKLDCNKIDQPAETNAFNALNLQLRQYRENSPGLSKKEKFELDSRC